MGRIALISHVWWNLNGMDPGMDFVQITMCKALLGGSPEVETQTFEHRWVQGNKESLRFHNHKGMIWTNKNGGESSRKCNVKRGLYKAFKRFGSQTRKAGLDGTWKLSKSLPIGSPLSMTTPVDSGNGRREIRFLRLL